MAKDNRCGAKTKSGGRCKRSPSKGSKSGRCKFHGGNNAKGIDHWNYKDGSRSKYMPKRVLELADESKNNPDLLNHLDNIALIDAYIKMKLEELRHGPNPADAIRDARRIFILQKEIITGKHGDNAIDRLPDLINEGVAVTAPALRRVKVWDELHKAMDRQKSHIDSAKNIELRGANAVSMNELLIFLSSVVQLIDKVIDDKEQNRALKSGIQDFIITEPT